MKLTFTFNGEPVAAQRVRRSASGGVYTPYEYMKYKKSMAEAIKSEFGFWSWDIPATGTKERAKYLKNNRYHLTVDVYRSKDKGDLDNFTKTVQDALQNAGVIANDSQIDSSQSAKFIDKENPRVEFTLTRIEK